MKRNCTSLLRVLVSALASMTVVVGTLATSASAAYAAEPPGMVAVWSYTDGGPHTSAYCPGDGSFEGGFYVWCVNWSWSPPTDDGGSPIESYEVENVNGPINVGLTTKFGDVCGLVFNQYTHVSCELSIRVRAINEFGPGPWSDPMDVQVDRVRGGGGGGGGGGHQSKCAGANSPIVRVTSGSVLEGPRGTTSSLIIPVTLSEPATVCPLRVRLQLTDVTARVGGPVAATGDYVSGRRPWVTFAVGATEAPLVLKVRGDSRVEPDETFTVHILSGSRGDASVDDATGTILNDD